MLCHIVMDSPNDVPTQMGLEMLPQLLHALKIQCVADVEKLLVEITLLAKEDPHQSCKR